MCNGVRCAPPAVLPAVARLEEEVGAAGASLQLVFLDSDASFPSDLQAANIHPMFVYVQVSQQKVRL